MYFSERGAAKIPYYQITPNHCPRKTPNCLSTSNEIKLLCHVFPLNKKRNIKHAFKGENNYPYTPCPLCFSVCWSNLTANKRENREFYRHHHFLFVVGKRSHLISLSEGQSFIIFSLYMLLHLMFPPFFMFVWIHCSCFDNRSTKEQKTLSCETYRL